MFLFLEVLNSVIVVVLVIYDDMLYCHNHEIRLISYEYDYFSNLENNIHFQCVIVEYGYLHLK